MAIESELKLGVPASALAAVAAHPVLALLGREPQSRRLATRYFDLPGGDIAAAGMVLRLRDDGGGAAVVTVKSGGGGLGLHRGEWEWPAADAVRPARADLERALRDTPLGGIGHGVDALDAGLRQVFGTAFERQTWRVDWMGSEVEVALDVGSCSARRDGAEVETPIHELELELLHGDFDACWDLAWALAQDLPLLLSPINKARRAAALAVGARIEAQPEPAPPSRSTPLGDAAAVWLETAAAQLAVWAEHITASDEARDVHQFRVVLRRLRTTLRWLKPHAPASTMDWFGAELRWAMQLAGAVRDVDVWIERLSGTGLKSAEPIIAALRQRRELQRAPLLAYLESARYGRLLLALARWSEVWRGGVHGADGRHALRRLAADAVEDARARWRVALADCAALRAALDPAALDALDVGRLHALRIRAKRLRLSIERLGHLRPRGEQGDLLRLRRLAEGMQTRLGAWHDAQRLREWLACGEPEIDARLRGDALHSLGAARALLGG